MPATVRRRLGLRQKPGNRRKTILSFWNPSGAEQVYVVVCSNPDLNLKHLKKWVIEFTLYLLLWISVLMEEHKCEIICLYNAESLIKHSLRLH